MTHNHGSGAVLLSIVLAMGLRILPWSRDWILFNPDWILLIVIYWCLTISERFNIGSAWAIGLVTDVLTGQLLGHNALTYSLIAYIVVRLHLRIRVFRRSRQIFVMFCLLLLSQFLVFWSQNMQGIGYPIWIYWAPACSGALMWPVVYWLLGGSQYHAKINWRSR
ncbi:MAG: rod shape-determining protein MreD [Methylococcales bacterium]